MQEKRASIVPQHSSWTRFEQLNNEETNYSYTKKVFRVIELMIDFDIIHHEINPIHTNVHIQGQVRAQVQSTASPDPSSNPDSRPECIHHPSIPRSEKSRCGLKFDSR